MKIIDTPDKLCICLKQSGGKVSVTCLMYRAFWVTCIMQSTVAISTCSMLLAYGEGKQLLVIIRSKSRPTAL